MTSEQAPPPRQRRRSSARTPHFEPRLLGRGLAWQATDRVLEMGYQDLDAVTRLAAGTMAPALAAPGHIVSLRPTVDLADALRALVSEPAGRRPTIEVRLAETVPADDTGAYDVVLLLAPFYMGNAVVRRDIETAYRGLRPGGSLYLQTHRRQGGETFVRFMAERFGSADLLGIAGGQRLYRAVRGAEPTRDASELGSESTVLDVAVRGFSVALEVQPGVFSRHRLDSASRLLAETMEIHPSDTVADLGCGTGVLGIVASRLAPQGRIVLLDNRVQVVELAERNLGRNGISNAEVHLSDGLREVSDRRFDVIVTNPPLHESARYGAAPAARFVAEAAAYLRAGGRLYVVGPQTLPLPRLASGHFGTCEVVATNRSSVVWRCTVPQADRAIGSAGSGDGSAAAGRSMGRR